MRKRQETSVLDIEKELAACEEECAAAQRRLDDADEAFIRDGSDAAHKRLEAARAERRRADDFYGRTAARLEAAKRREEDEKRRALEAKVDELRARLGEDGLRSTYQPYFDKEVALLKEIGDVRQEWTETRTALLSELIDLNKAERELGLPITEARLLGTDLPHRHEIREALEPYCVGIQHMGLSDRFRADFAGRGKRF